MIMSPFCSLVIQNGGGVLTSSSGTAHARGRHESEGWRQRSIDRRSENNFFYGFVRADLWAIFFRRQHGFEVL